MEKPCAGSLVDSQPQLPIMWESHHGNPVHLSMGATPATIWAWATANKNHLAESSQPTETWKMINYCFKLLNFGEVCYAAIDNQITFFQLVLICEPRWDLATEWLCFHEGSRLSILLFSVPLFSHLWNIEVGLKQVITYRSSGSHWLKTRFLKTWWQRHIETWWIKNWDSLFGAGITQPSVSTLFLPLVRSWLVVIYGLGTKSEIKN